MSRFDDDEDVKADDLLAGRAVPGHEPLAVALGILRAQADEPAPAPSPALASVLRNGLPAAALGSPVPTAGARSRVLRGVRWATGLGVAGKVLLGAGIAAAAVAGTATLPVVPDSVQTPVRAALTDLGHLIPGSTGGSVPVPSTTTPEPVDGAVSSEDPPPAEPDTRTPDVPRRPDDFAALRPVPTDAPGRRGVGAVGVESPGADAGRQGKSSDATPTARPSETASQDQLGPGHGRPSASSTPTASEGNGTGPSQGGQSGN